MPNKKLENFIEKLIDFNDVSVGFKAEFRDIKVSISGLRLRNPILTASIRQSIIANVSRQISSKDKKKLYILWKERKKEEFKEKLKKVVVEAISKQIIEMVGTADNFETLEALEEIKKKIDRMIDISNIANVKFKSNKKGKIRIKFEKANAKAPQVTLRNPILDASLRQAVTNNISNILNGKNYDEVRDNLYKLWKESKPNKSKKDEFDLILRDTIVDIVFNAIFNLESDENDLPTPVCPTSVALSEIPNYYICEPKETYTLETKIELFNKLADTTVVGNLI